jgi:hypothetical protein
MKGSDRNHRVTPESWAEPHNMVMESHWAALRALAFAANAASQEPLSALKNARKGAFCLGRQVAQGAL